MISLCFSYTTDPKLPRKSLSIQMEEMFLLLTLNFYLTLIINVTFFDILVYYIEKNTKSSTLYCFGKEIILAQE